MSGRQAQAKPDGEAEDPAASEVVPRSARTGAGASSSRHVNNGYATPAKRQAKGKATHTRPEENMATYPRAGASEVPAQPDFPELERRALAYWNAHDTFKASVSNRDNDAEFVFYDGPPFANGLPHYGHLLTGYVKDIVPRYKTMRGAKVDRRFGWDCHGLPAEVEAERLLGISG